MVLSTGMGSIDDSLDRLPTAYGWGGTGLLILAVGFALGYRELQAGRVEPGRPGRPGPPALGMTAPVVLVPGLGLGPESYAPTVEHLDTQYDVVTLPGYGERAARGDDLHTDALAERLAEQITETPAVLVGHSASCQIVVAAALAHPELAKALVLVAPSGDVDGVDLVNTGCPVGPRRRVGLAEPRPDAGPASTSGPASPRWHGRWRPRATTTWQLRCQALVRRQ